MLLKLDGADRAERIAEMVRVVAQERADWATMDDWADADVRAEFVAMLRSMQAWTTGPEWDRVVEVRPRLRPDGDYWTGTAAAVLDTAAGRVDDELGDTYTFDHGRIEDIPGSHGARLVCERKPNLQRAFYDLWRGYAPMVAVDLDGVTYHLNWSQQRLAVTVANRYAYRHDFSRKVFGYNLLLLARVLDVDTVTAVRLSWLVAPDHCGVYLERNTALRIVDAEEELAVTRALGGRALGGRA
jgi:hypothetical protein